MNEIKRLRAKAAMTQAEFGAMCGVSEALVCRWEKGNRAPTPFMLSAIRAAVAEHLKEKRE